MNNRFLLAANDTQLGLAVRLLAAEGINGSVDVQTFGVGKDVVEGVVYRIWVDIDEKRFEDIRKKYKFLTA